MDTLTKAELGRILRGVNRAMFGKCSRADFEAVMAWATQAALDRDLLELVLSGDLDPYVNEQGVLGFMPTAKGLAGSKRQQLERIG